MENKKMTTGERLKKILKDVDMTQEELAEKIKRTPDEPYSANYISMIVNNKRNLTVKLASKITELEEFKVKGIRKEYLLGFDEYETDRERASSIIKKSVDSVSCVEQLMVLHGYSKEELTDEKGKLRVALISPRGEKRYYTSKEYLSFLHSLNDVFEGQLLFQFRQLTDGTKEYWNM